MTPRQERRACGRREPESDATKTVRLRTGLPAAVLDSCPSGLGLETSGGLAPGALVDLVVVSGAERRCQRAVVVYAHVCRLSPTRGARYRVGLRLYSPVHLNHG